MTHRVVFTPKARDQLGTLHAYIASVADAETAARFVDGTIDHAATLADFPRGARRATICCRVAHYLVATARDARVRGGGP